MASFVIEKFNGGLSDFEDRGIQGAYKFASNIDPRKKRDSISAGQALTDDLAVGGIMNSKVISVVTASDTNSYWFLSNGKILKRTSSGTWSLAYTDSDGGIVGASEGYNNVGDTFIYWRTATKLHRKRILGTGYTDTGWTDVDATVNGQSYPKSNLTSTTYGMTRWINGNLLGLNGNTLYMVGYDDSYTNNALQLIPANIGKALIESGTDVKVLATRLDSQQKSMIFYWDGMAQNYNEKFQLPFANANTLIESEVGVVQFGTNGDLYFVGDTSRIPVTSFPSGGQVDPEGADVYGGLILLGVYGNGTGKTGIYSYGRKFKNAPFILNLEYQLDCDEINAVKVIGTGIYVAYKSGSNYGVKKADTSNKASRAIYQSVDLKAPHEIQRLAEFGQCILTTMPLPSGCSIELYRRVDKVETGGDGSGWYQCNTTDGSTSYSTTGSREATFLIGDKGKIIELKVVLNCYGNYTPEILKIQLAFK